MVEAEDVVRLREPPTADATLEAIDPALLLGTGICVFDAVDAVLCREGVAVGRPGSTDGGVLFFNKTELVEGTRFPVTVTPSGVAGKLDTTVGGVDGNENVAARVWS